MPLILIFLLAVLGFSDAANAASGDIFYAPSISHPMSGSIVDACEQIHPVSAGTSFAYAGNYSTGVASYTCQWNMSGASTGLTDGGSVLKFIDCNGQINEWTAALSQQCPAAPPPACPAHQKLSFGSSASSTSYCIGGCEVVRIHSACGSKDGVTSCFVDGETTGNTCTPDSGSGSLTPEQKCLASGGSYGQVNGVNVCVPRISSGAADVTVSDTTTTTTTPPPTPQDPNPTPVTSTSTTTTTYNNSSSSDGTSGSGSVGETKTNSDGSTTTTTSSTENFCQQNPNSTMCKAQNQCIENPNGPTCKHFCEAYPNASACKTAEDLIGKPSDIPADDTFTEQTISPNSFSAIAMPSSNSCPPDTSITLYGSPITISYAWICSYASAFKPLVIAFAMLTAAFIVVGGINNDRKLRGI